MKFAIKELTLGEVFDQSFKMLQEKFGLIFGILCCLQIPVGVVGGILIGMSIPDLENATFDEMMQAMNSIRFYTMGLALVNLLVFPITQAAIIHAVAKSYTGETVTIGDCYNQAFKRFGPLLGTYIMVYLVVVVGLVLCIIPGIIFSLWYAMAGPVVVIENESGGGAMGRSKALAEGNLGTIFALFFLIGLINGGVGLGFEYLPIPMVVNQIIAQLISSIMMAFAATALVIFYFSCRCKKEGFDLEILAKSFGGGAGPGGFSRPGYGDGQAPGGHTPSDPNNPYS